MCRCMRRSDYRSRPTSSEMLLRLRRRAMSALDHPVGSASGGLAVDVDELRSHVGADPEASATYHDSGVRSRLVWHLLRIRKTRKLGQRVVAKSMGTTQSVVSELEQGNTDPRLSSLQRYARAIGCRLDLALVEDVSDGSSNVWRPRVHFSTWRNRSLPYNYQILPVRVETEPQKIWGVKLELQHEADGAQRWKAPTHTRHLRVMDVDVTSEPDEFLLAVRRG